MVAGGGWWWLVVAGGGSGPGGRDSKEERAESGSLVVCSTHAQGRQCARAVYVLCDAAAAAADADAIDTWLSHLLTFVAHFTTPHYSPLSLSLSPSISWCFSGVVKYIDDLDADQIKK